MAEDSGVRTFRPAFLGVIQWVGTPVAFGIWLYAAAEALTTSKHPGSQVGNAVFCLLMGVLSGLLMFRLGRSRMVITETEVVVVNPIRQYVVPRSEISTIGVSRGASWAIMKTQSGRSVPVFALSTGFKWTLRRRMDDVNTALGFRSA